MTTSATETPNRARNRMAGSLTPNGSPTTTISDSTGAAARTVGAMADANSGLATLKLSDLPKTSFRNVVGGGHDRKTVVRADPSMLTCFDATDKELYDLWAPKR